MSIPNRVLVTGSSGLIGSEIVTYFSGLGSTVHGIDNNARADFFGPEGDTRWNLMRIKEQCPSFTHHELDIRNRADLFDLLRRLKFDLVVHCAAQPSHDLAARRPLDDFDVNALGTINLLEAIRQDNQDAVFVFMSTNKVYGDTPNKIPRVELPTRWEYAQQQDFEGIDETCKIDQSLHSIFGASKIAADIMTQEYGRYYGLRTTVLRGGCLTGPNHSGCQLHGFLSYFGKVAMLAGEYTIFGYKGKQVRDNIHSIDVCSGIHEIFKNPRQGEVYNLGGGRENSISILEAIDAFESITGNKIEVKYVDEPRRGDHICYITNLSKFKQHYPNWRITKTLDNILDEIVSAWKLRLEQ